METKKVIFICTANRCRSIMAEYCLRQLLEEKPLSGTVEVQSAGIMAEEYWDFYQGFLASNGLSSSREHFYGVPPYPSTISCLHKRGWDIQHYKSQELSPSLAKSASLIVAMESEQKEATLTSFQGLDDKVLTLRELSDEASSLLLEESYYQPVVSLSDPHYVYYGEDYVEGSYEEINKCLKNGFKNLMKHLQLTILDKKDE